MIALGSDQAGYELKQVIMQPLRGARTFLQRLRSYSPDPVELSGVWKKGSTCHC